MKSLYCGLCGDLRALQVEPVKCKCGNVEAWWTNPLTGQFLIRANIKSRARIIGMHNSVLRATFVGPMHHKDWAKMHESVIGNSPGYIFAKEHRACWACVIVPGETNDGGWSPDSVPYYEEMKRDGFVVYIKELVHSEEPLSIFEVEAHHADNDWRPIGIMHRSTVAGARELANLVIDSEKKRWDDMQSKKTETPDVVAAPTLDDLKIPLTPPGTVLDSGTGHVCNVCGAPGAQMYFPGGPLCFDHRNETLDASKHPT